MKLAGWMIFMACVAAVVFAIAAYYRFLANAARKAEGRHDEP